MRTILYILFSCLLLSACDSRPKEQPSIKVITQKDVEEKSKAANKEYTLMERDAINAYLKTHPEKFITTGSGLYYVILESSTNKKKAETGQVAKVAYDIKLIDGTPCYNSNEDGIKRFMIGSDNVESGLHEAIQLMHLGEKARFLMPSHLAHGLMGDMDKIPPKAILIYDIELLGLE
jgi:FKBP-type peptidyl-prolyl cis-trans isomerase FkpA